MVGFSSPYVHPKLWENCSRLGGQTGISIKFYSRTFLGKLLTRKDFNPICCLEMLAASTFEKTAIVKLWRYFCLIGFPNFFTPSPPSRGKGGRRYFLISCRTTKLNSLTVVRQSLASPSRLQQGKGFREAFFAPDEVEDIPGGKDKVQFWTGNDFTSSFYCNHCGACG